LLTKWLANNWLIMKFGTIGASLATILSLGLVLFIIRLGLPDSLKKECARKGFALKLGTISLVMAALVWGGTQGMEKWVFNGGHRTDAFVLTLIGVMIGISVFLSGLFHLNVLTIREWLSLPFGKKILRKQVKENGEN
ncbi:MAG: polysaccharide biosynthesis C-terminal domain-containing protein, partial [Carnobacterium sp.]